MEKRNQVIDQDWENAWLFGNDQKTEVNYDFMAPMTNVSCAVSPSAPCLCPEDYTKKMIEMYKNTKLEVKQ
jgi:hypothetical protein